MRGRREKCGKERNGDIFVDLKTDNPDLNVFGQIYRIDRRISAGKMP